MRSLLGQVGLDSRGRQENTTPSQDHLLPPHADDDLPAVMGTFASPKRFGHYGLMGDVSTVAYETFNGLLAVVTSGGMVKVFGGPGVELVLQEEGSTAYESPSYLVFPTASLLVGITKLGSVLVWNLGNGSLCGQLPGPLDPSIPDDEVTAVHFTQNCGRSADADNVPVPERYVYLGFESGRIRVVQVFPDCRVSGYVLEARDISSGVPDKWQAPGGSGRLGAVTAVTSWTEGSGVALALVGFRYGCIVLWDLVRRKRLGLHGIDAIASVSEGRAERGDGSDHYSGCREITSLAFHPSREVFAAGFAEGYYALFPAAASRDIVEPRWVTEVGDDGSCRREGPTIVRTPVSMVKWVRIRHGERGTWGLVVAGGVEIDEGEDPDGVSLLVPSHDSEAAVLAEGSGGGRAKRHMVAMAALAALETAVFMPFALGQETLSCVHAEVICTSRLERADDREVDGSERSAPEPHVDLRGNVTANSSQVEAKDPDRVARALVVFGLVRWTEEVRGENGRLHFRRASSIKACPVKTLPYVALLQLVPENLGPHLSGLAPVTAMASAPLLSSSTILNFVTCLGEAQHQDAGRDAIDSLLRGGGLQWANSIPPARRDEALSTVELLVVGHSDGRLSFWECCAPASRNESVQISDGRMRMCEVPSGATPLGSLKASELSCGEGVARPVSTLDVWVERDHVALAERDACWVAVGFDSGEAAVFVLTNRVQVVSNGGAREHPAGGARTTLANEPISITNVEISDARDGNDDDQPGWKRFFGAELQASDNDGDCEDPELDAAIAAARAEALAIQASDETDAQTDQEVEGSPRAPPGGNSAVEMGDDGSQAQGVPQGSVEDLGEEGTKDDHVERTGSLPSLSSPSPRLVDAQETKERHGGEGQKASLLQLVLRLHGHAIRSVTMLYDTSASSLALVVADAEGVVSVTNVATGSASLLPMRAPQVRPCYPAVTIGPLPDALAGNSGTRRRRPQGPRYGTSGALFVFLEGWLNVFDLASRDPIDIVDVPGLGIEDESIAVDQKHRDASTSSLTPGRTISGDPRGVAAWIVCVDEHGVPIVPYASEPLDSFTPSNAHDDGIRQENQPGRSVDDAREDEGADGCQPSEGRTQTIWVSPLASRTALEGYHEHDLQMLNGSPPPKPFLVIVRGAIAAAFAVTQKESFAVSFSRRSAVASKNVGVFRSNPGVQLVMRARANMPPAEGWESPPTIDSMGVCLVAVGEGRIGSNGIRRGCLVTTDASGFARAFLLPYLSPVFCDRLPPGDRAGRGSRSTVPFRKWPCNLVGELTLCGASQELSRWSLLTDEAYEAVMDAKPRLSKVSNLVSAAAREAMSRQSSDGSAGGGDNALQSRAKGPMGMLGRISLGGSRKTLVDVFAVEPPPPSTLRQGPNHGQPPAGRSPRRTMGRVSIAGGGSRRRNSSSDVQDSQRRALFGDREAEDRSAAAGGSGAATPRTRGGVSEAHAAISEAHDLAVIRGEKLENAVDKSRQLEESALAFGEMAKQLRKQQEEEACCIT